MAGLVIPTLDEQPWPTLGPQVCELLEERAIYGPGDLRGEPYVVDDETRALLYRMYEVFPRGHPRAGKRRFKRCAISLRKGTAKSEKAALIAYAELHPEAPVRCDGFRKVGRSWEPVGRPVRDSYIPLVAYTEEQSDELAYGALLVIVTEGPDVDLFDPGIERIMRVNGDGKAVSLAAAPSARDGARTTFQVFDETHRMTLPRLISAHGTMLNNVPKRYIADPWTLEVTTSYAPGEGSVAEKTHEYAQQVHEGRIKDSRLFYFHRQAGTVDINDEESVRAGVIEASGPAAEWSDIDGIVDLWRDPTTDRAYFERVWLNRPAQTADQAFDAKRWKELAVPGDAPEPGELITVGFDGARFHDATALIGTHVVTGRQFVIGIWEQPLGPSGANWEVPADEVEFAVETTFETWNVWRMYADPPTWEGNVATWQGRYGEKRVISWWTNRYRAAAFMVRAYKTAMTIGEVTHDGNDRFAAHIGHARKKPLGFRDDEGLPLWILRKERPDSPLKIDAAMAGALSWEARRDAIAAGVLDQEPEPEYAQLFTTGRSRR